MSVLTEPFILMNFEDIGPTGNSELTPQESLLNESRITPTGNGSLNTRDTAQITNGQKWWAAVIVGLIFALISSPPAYVITSHITGINSTQGHDSNLIGLLLHTLIFTAIIRIILW